MSEPMLRSLVEQLRSGLPASSLPDRPGIRLPDRRPPLSHDYPRECPVIDL
jgi:hypothetical protein